MDKKTVNKIINILSTCFDDVPALEFKTEYQLLVAVILSAQCTDERVNKITRELFKDYGTPETMITLSQEELEKKIFSAGFYRNKAKHILQATQVILDKYDGKVPNNLEDLRSLAGVGRKTANVVYSVAFKGNAIAVDTHVFRVSNRIGIVNEKDVLKTELSLMKAIDEKDWSRAHHYIIYLGRSYCKASKPDCANCPINKECLKRIKGK